MADIGNHSWTYAAEVKTALTPRHPLKAFTEPHPGRTFELLEGSKSRLPILLVVVYKKSNLM